MINTLSNFSEVLQKILTVIDFKEDKGAFINKFSDTIYQSAFLELVKTLPLDKRSNIESELTKSTTDDEKIGVINKYFSPQSIKTAVVDASRKLMEEYMQTILPTLSAPQTAKLREIIPNLQASVKAYEENSTAVSQV